VNPFRVNYQKNEIITIIINDHLLAYVHSLPLFTVEKLKSYPNRSGLVPLRNIFLLVMLAVNNINI
jgi:hypothetical protein